MIKLLFENPDSTTTPKGDYLSARNTHPNYSFGYYKNKLFIDKDILHYDLVNYIYIK